MKHISDNHSVYIFFLFKHLIEINLSEHIVRLGYLRNYIFNNMITHTCIIAKEFYVTG